MTSKLYSQWESLPEFVPPAWPDLPGVDVVIVSAGVEKIEALRKEHLAGQSGKFIRFCLSSSGWNTQRLAYSSVFKLASKHLSACCQAPKSRRQSPQWLGDAPQWLSLLNEELSQHSPKLVIAIGNIPLAALTGRWGIYKWRGSLLPSIHHSNIMVLPILDTENILLGATEDKFLIQQDLKKALKLYQNNLQTEKRQYLTATDEISALTFLRKCYQMGIEGTPISFDIEVKNQELNCISLAYSKKGAMSIAFVNAQGDTMNPISEAKVMRAIGAILSSPSIRKQGQNLIFDTHFLLRKYGIRTHNIDDSMVAQHTFLPQLPKGLDMITSLWTDIPYYKDDGKDWIRGGGTYDKLWVYNCLDSIVVQESMPKLLHNLALTDNMPAYERQLSIIEPCCYMMERGIKVNLSKLRYERELMKAEVEAAKTQLAQIASGLNPNSPKQMQDYFYGKLRISPYKNKHHKISVDSEALKRIARARGKGAEEARLILEIKKKEKLISTYLQDNKFDTDSRIRCSYNPVGTTYSRLSSSSSIFGTGMNMQNWPHSMLKYLEPDEGYVLYTMDLSQAENRIVAYVGRIEKMIEAFETGQDVHRLTASLIFNKSPSEISDEPGSCSLGNGESTERQWGKKANHGLNYDLGYKSFAILYDMPEKDAKFIVDRYHQSYPELGQNFHGYVKKSLQKDRTIINLMGRKTIFVTDLIDSTYKAAYSCIPQGTVGDIINERGMAFIYHNKSKFAPIEILQQVHDSISFQIPLPPVVSWEEHAYMLFQIKASLETPVQTHYGREFVIPVDTVMGLSFMKEEGEEFKSKKWPKSVSVLTSQLSEAYQKLVERKNERAI